MNRIDFSVNGEKCSVGEEISSDVMLVDFLRKNLELRGTKYMCREGGCGACIVSAVKTPGAAPTAVNSCLVSPTSCQDWDIKTIEKIGNRLDGYHVLQKTLAKYNGTQCGYCTAGWIMSMFSLLESKKDGLTMLEIEELMSSNTCRCTGYRPILDAFKSFAKDAPKTILADIEDLHICQKTGNECKRGSCDAYDWCIVNRNLFDDPVKEIKLKDGKLWYKVQSVNAVFTVLNKHSDKSYMLIFGNTGKGVTPIAEYPDVLIDISGIAELKQHSLNQNLVLGAGITLNEAIDIFTETSNNEYFGYLTKLKEHILLVANTSVRNLASLGGNLMLKHATNSFASDIFLLLETVGATLAIVDAQGSRQDMKPKDFLKLDMKNKIIVNIEFPPLNDNYKLTTFKIMPRSQNATARVNAGFLYKLSADNETVTAATVVYGNINPSFIHAEKTEAYLVGKNLFKNEILQQALNILSGELNVQGYPDYQIQSKKKIALGLFYKGLLTICPSDKLNARYRSGATTFSSTRPVSSGQQVFDTNPLIYPLNQPIPKLEALIQCSGEAPYVNDVPCMPREVFASFVLSTVAVGEIDNIDASPALNLEGVVAFFSAKDIPGRNSFIPREYFFNLLDEEVLCSGKVKFYNQPLGVIVAESEYLANKAASLVKVTYKGVQSPVLTIKDAKSDVSRIRLGMLLPAIDRGLNTTKVIKGGNNIYEQYHYHMETQVCVTRPTDDGIEVNCSTQWLDAVQISVATALNIKENTINMSVSRLGGSFGAKISRATQVAVACSLVTHKLNRPCRMALPLETNMRAIGKRLPSSSEFEVGVNKVGEIQYMEYHLYEDQGHLVSEPFLIFSIPGLKNNYNRNRWSFKGFNVVTDTCKKSWARAPGTLEMISMIEYIMEQISYELSLDPISVRLVNMSSSSDESAAKEIIETLKKDAEYDKRLAEVKKFNEDNRWKKRGLRFSCMKFSVPTLTYYNVSLTVHHGDGTVVITHGGVEMGQGINTKAVQVCAYCLNIPIEMIKVKATNNITNPNGMCTSSSTTSETVCIGVIKCCQMLLDRLSPIRILVGGAGWELLIKKAYSQGVNLVTSYTASSNDQTHYYVPGATLTETEVDILTGEIQINRVDLIEDVGQSLSPEVDIGQIEGAFIMGLGYWTCEELIYDQNTGELLTDRSLTYHVPLARDVPLDFRVCLKKNSYNDLGVLGSKATGEPATCMAISVAFAIRAAIAASRYDSGIPTTTWFHIDGPYSLDNIILAANVGIEEFKFN